jgi:poly-gamma-glutamate synthesis protein (capsule biosynthesis protein)
MIARVLAVLLALIIVTASAPLAEKHVLKPVLDPIVHSNIADFPDSKVPDTTITLLATGDVIPARSVNTQTFKHNDFTWAFKNVSELLSEADITLIDLETPLIKNCPLTDEGFKFCGDYRHIEGLKLAGVDIVTLANNHSTNYGSEGLQETQELLRNNDISYAGTGETVYKEVNGTKFAFLSFNDVGEFPFIDGSATNHISGQVSEAAKSAEIVVVSFHWGDEYVPEPNERQKELAYLAIDNGADLVIGNHPHQIQPGEWYKGKYIKYAHGNFIFDQMWSEGTKQGVIGKYVFTDGSLTDVQFVPIYIENYGQPKLVSFN